MRRVTKRKKIKFFMWMDHRKIDLLCKKHQRKHIQWGVFSSHMHTETWRVIDRRCSC